MLVQRVAEKPHSKCTFEATQDKIEAKLVDLKAMYSLALFLVCLMVARGAISGAVAKRDQVVSIPIA